MARVYSGGGGGGGKLELALARFAPLLKMTRPFSLHGASGILEDQSTVVSLAPQNGFESCISFQDGRVKVLAEVARAAGPSEVPGPKLMTDYEGKCPSPDATFPTSLARIFLT